MANSISVRSAQFVQFNVDTNAAGGAAVSILANRQYAVVDYTYVNTWPLSLPLPCPPSTRPPRLLLSRSVR